MKVEFKDSVFGYSLYVDISQFLLAQESDEEFDSLYRAVYAFYSTFCFDFTVDKIYDDLCEQIGKRGKVIFTCAKLNGAYEKCPEIYALCNNNIRKIYSGIEEE